MARRLSMNMKQESQYGQGGSYGPRDPVLYGSQPTKKGEVHTNKMFVGLFRPAEWRIFKGKGVFEEDLTVADGDGLYYAY